MEGNKLPTESTTHIAKIHNQTLRKDMNQSDFHCKQGNAEGQCSDKKNLKDRDRTKDPAQLTESEIRAFDNRSPNKDISCNAKLAVIHHMLRKALTGAEASLQWVTSTYGDLSK